MKLTMSEKYSKCRIKFSSLLVQQAYILSFRWRNLTLNEIEFQAFYLIF